MHFVRRLGLLACSVFLGFLASAAHADNPKVYLRIEKPSVVTFGGIGADTVVLLPVQGAGVKEVSVKLVKVEKGAATVYQTVRIHPPAKNNRDDLFAGNLALLLIKRKERKVVEARLGNSFKGGGKIVTSRGRVTVPASDFVVYFATPSGNWPVGQTAVVYGRLCGTSGDKGEIVDIAGKPVENVQRISKRYPHLSYILVVLSWSPSEGK